MAASGKAQISAARSPNSGASCRRTSLALRNRVQARVTETSTMTTSIELSSAALSVSPAPLQPSTCLLYTSRCV